MDPFQQPTQNPFRRFVNQRLCFYPFGKKASASQDVFKAQAGRFERSHQANINNVPWLFGLKSNVKVSLIVITHTIAMLLIT